MAPKKVQAADERFLRTKTDPRFWEMPEKERKVTIDKRFRAMFHDERFKLKYTVDKRGRPVNRTSAEDLKRFYNLSDSSEEEEEKSRQKEKKKAGKSKVNKLDETDEKQGEEAESSPRKDAGPHRDEQLIRGVRLLQEAEEEEEPVVDGDEDDADLGAQLSDGEEDEDEDESDDGSEGASSSESEESDSGPDLARGKGNVETSSDEDEDEDVDVDGILQREEEEIEHDWGEMWKDAPRTEDTTRRLAVCNMNWDRMKAKDILALFNSFKPKGGVVLSVKIYPSEFGKERMQAERTQGPLELVTLPEDPEQDTEEQKVYRERRRDYQFKRLRYYFAVVECDSPETAANIYEDCDGFEYESSCSILDLRFIPDDMSFEGEKPEDVATDVDLSSYTPKLFTSTAAATSKVELTWDETDHERVTALSKTFKKDELLEMDFNAYLASSSEDEEEQEEKQPEVDLPVARPVDPTEHRPKKEKSTAEQISKYRELLKVIQDKEKKHEDKGMEMEVTWVPGLKEKTEQLVKNKLQGKEQLTPWEEFLEKKKEKRKQKQAKGKQVTAEADLSDEELPADVDLNDPFFAEELSSTALKAKSKQKKGRKLEEVKSPEEEEEQEKQKAEMALLMEDDGEDGKHKHFNYDKIVEQQNLSKRKRKRLLKKNPSVEKDDFQVDVKDPRFQAIFTSHHYNLDPSDPGYRETSATRSIVEEKRRRRDEQAAAQEAAVLRQEVHARKQEVGAVLPPPKAGMDPGLSMLVKSIKSKTQQFQARKKPRIS